MSEPWDLRIDDERQANTKTTFIIFCEDEVSEPVYFKFFETSEIKVNCIPKQKSMMDNVVNAIHHCKEHNLLLEEEDSLIDGIQVWCVFDRDKEETQAKIDKGNIEFDESIEVAERKGIKVAWSNDAFEIWILLHFEEIDQTERADVYERLTEIFKSFPEPNEDLTKALRYYNFNYKENLKSETNFRNIIRAEITDKTNEAIERAKNLDQSYPLNGKPSEKAPCTKLYLLVEELLHYGQKINETV